MKRFDDRDRGVATQFLLQGVLVCATSIPLYFVFRNPVLLEGGLWSLKNILSVGMISYGIVAETISDTQLETFKDKKKNGETNEPFCRNGYWLKSRHPNLFFETMMWTGFGLYGRF